MLEQESSSGLLASLAPHYVIERELGRGGMATVYLAEEVKHRRRVAIKALRADVSSTLGAERFLREIGIAAQLSHPHLVPLIDSGEAAGLLYYVSPYLAGGSLRERLEREGRLPVADALRIAEEIGAALDFAHRAGYVHRDVKPENILLADGHALLADFGIARAFCGDVGDPITGVGFALGTPAYMSPEQAAADPQIDGRSDQYGLACVVFEMLAGSPPFAGPSARALLTRHLVEPPPHVRSLRAEVSPAVDAAIARALAKDPAHRHSTIADFVAALRSGAAPVSRVYRITRSIAVLPFVNASPNPENEYLSDGITDELIDALAKVEGLRVASRTSVFALKGKPQDVRAIGALLDCAVVLEGSVRRAGSQLRITAQLSSTDDGRLLWSQRYDRQLDDVFAVQNEIARMIVNTLRATSFADLAAPAPRPQTRSARAYHLYLQGRYEWNRRTQEGVAAGIRFFEAAIAEDPDFAPAYTGLADCHALGVDYRSVPVDAGLEAAKRYARQAIALDDSLAEAHASLAWILFIYDWDWAGAEAAYRRAIDLDPRYASAHQWYAFLLAARGDFGEALVEGHTAIELDAGSVSARRSLAWIYYYARRYDQARYHLDRAIAMNPNAEETFRVLGLALAMEGDLPEAIRVLRDTVHMEGAGTYSQATLGYALARAGESGEARAILGELRDRAAHEYVTPVAFATLHLGLGEYEAALDWAERSVEQRRGWLTYAAVNPIFDPLRGHPRFEALARRVRQG